jgi:hypothetical protein
MASLAITHFTDSAQSQSHITTDDQSVSESWFRAPSGAHDQMLIAGYHYRLYSLGTDHKENTAAPTVASEQTP